MSCLSFNTPAGETLEIVAEHAAPRLDRFLAEAAPALSRSRVQRLIAQGHVARSAVVVREPAIAVAAGTRFTISLPAPVVARPAAQAIALDILYEDDALIVLDKPAGLVVHPAPGNPDRTLVNALIAHCGDTLAGIGGERRPGIVHRLDKETSGLMVVAKTETALARLGAAFAARDLDRAYSAVCWGVPMPSVGTIEGAIGRDPRERKRMAVVANGGKPALTRYITQRNWHAAATLLRCELATGRTHQIRVHFASRGHPLVGDPVYLRRVPAVARLLPPCVHQVLLDFPRQALHATLLGFAHPVSGAKLQFERRPPSDMSTLISALDASL